MNPPAPFPAAGELPGRASVGKQPVNPPPGVCRSGATFRDPFVMIGLRPRRLDAARMLTIAQLVADECGLTLAELRSSARPERISIPRMLAYTLQTEATGGHPDAVGDWWGKTRNTVEHGIKATHARAETVPSFRLFFATLKTKAGITHT